MIKDELIEMTSFEAIKYVLEDTELHPLQCIDVMKMLYQKKAIVSYDTGLGKTYLMAAAMRLLWREDSQRRFIVFGMKDQLQQTPKKIMALTGRSVITSAADENSIGQLLYGEEYLNYPVILLTHQCLLNHVIMKEIWKNKDKFYGVFIDEAHKISNKNFAQSASIISGLVSQFEYCIALTATPIITNTKQLCRLANTIDPKRYPNPVKMEKNINRGDFCIQDDPLFFINRNGKDLGRNSRYIGHVAWVDSEPFQREPFGGYELMQLCKGDGAVKQAKMLISLCEEYCDKRGLVYINQHSVREWVLPFFDKAGIKYRCINGMTGPAERARIMQEFNEEKSIQVVITSVTTAIDLDCDYVIFYEFTTEIKQMIGRADRGLEGKSLDIWYVITRGSFEPKFFWDNIICRSKLVEQILGKDIKEISTVIDSIEKEVEASDTIGYSRG